ncbi:MAG: Ig-like domain-containing protein [Eubacteriales bacterium]|nr:Ig-like domain-containing protein [Eubacteriales bacterium]
MKRALAWALCLALLMGLMPARPGAALAQETVAAEQVRLSASKATMDLNGKNQGKLRVTVSPANATEPLVWVSNAPSVATVDDQGVVTAVGVGQAIIGVRGANTAWSKCRITVINTGSSSGGSAPTPGATAQKAEIRFRVSSAKMDLNGISAGKIGYTLSDPAAQVEWVTTNPNVCTVDANGVVTAVGVGSCIIGARANGGSWAKCKITVVNSARPASVEVETTSLTLSPGSYYDCKASILPERADQSLYWKSADPAIAAVNQNGRIVAGVRGTTYIRVYSAVNRIIYKQITVSVGLNAPTHIHVDQTIYELSQGASMNVDARAMPETAAQGLIYVSSDPSVASVAADGTITGHKHGKAVIRIYSAESAAVYTAIGVRVTGHMPESIGFSTVEFYFAPGDSVTLVPTIRPEGCLDHVVWHSSDPNVVSVDANGKITALAQGTARITATTVYGALSASVQVTVLAAEYTTTVPARYTSAADLKKNLAKIDAVEESANNALETLLRTGSLSLSEANARKQIIRRAFAMYRFPWMTPVEQRYWRTSSSLGGAKDYQPGRMYYGLPYIQCGTSGDFTARRFNEINAVSGGYYTDTGRGYYLMSQTKKYDGMYAGNDCSSFVSLAQWGMGNAHSYDYTGIMLTTPAYRTIAWGREMKPGDILVMDGHCVMFLYYTDAARTQMMIIEQGGGNAVDIHNTVCCSVVNVAAYRSAGYIVRRQASFAG